MPWVPPPATPQVRVQLLKLRRKRTFTGTERGLLSDCAWGQPSRSQGLSVAYGSPSGVRNMERPGGSRCPWEERLALAADPAGRVPPASPGPALSAGHAW